MGYHKATIPSTLEDSSDIESSLKAVCYSFLNKVPLKFELKLPVI